ncbi:MAG TPA: efflux RND transporter periplasmic adaptor subunit [Candidatus Polarisedimenticolia bacterium]|nr:efflux RND transporter periplasmic adaptor subunit [Candidatus Polarisedimenticolia bacterium]
MKRAVFLLVLLKGLGCLGCGSEGPDGHASRELQEAPPAGHEESAIPGTVRIDPEMLRDLRITTAAAEAREGGEGVTVLGEVGVNEESYAEVGSPIGARIVRLLASPGDPVARGQALVELQSLELGKARAAWLSAKARAELAERTLERKRGLAAERIAPVRELQEAEAETKAAEAEVQSAAALLQALGVSADGGASSGPDASLLVLRAPIAGTVIQRDGARGRMAEPSRPLFRIAELSRLWVTVHAFERDAVRIKAGAPARLAFPALPGRSFPGTVARIGRQVDAASRTIPVRIDVLNETQLLRPGMSATAWLPVGGGGASIVSVPSASLQRMQEGWYVFLPGAAGQFEMREVGRGRDLGGEVEILSGLQPGEWVVVEGAFLLKAEAEKSRGEGEHHDH